MPYVRRTLLAAGAVLALAVPTADAATRMVATATPEAPQFSPAGNITNVRVSCAAEDRAAVHTWVRCWTSSSLVASMSQYLPAAAATARGYSPLYFTLCAEARFTLASGFVSSTGVRCAPGEFGVAALTG